MTTKKGVLIVNPFPTFSLGFLLLQGVSVLLRFSPRREGGAPQWDASHTSHTQAGPAVLRLVTMESVKPGLEPPLNVGPSCAGKDMSFWATGPGPRLCAAGCPSWSSKATHCSEEGE